MERLAQAGEGVRAKFEWRGGPAAARDRFGKEKLVKWAIISI